MVDFAWRRWVLNGSRGTQPGEAFPAGQTLGANRVQPANSKGGNWWQSPLCGAHTDRHFRERRVMRRHLIRGNEKEAGYGEVSWAWTNRVQPANSKGGNWWQSPLCGAHTDRH